MTSSRRYSGALATVVIETALRSETMRTVADSMSEPVLVDRATTIQEASARMLDGGAAIAVGPRRQPLCVVTFSS
jgi:hypothetical protein